MEQPIDTNTGNNEAGKINFGPITKPSPLQEAVENMKTLANMYEFIDTVDRMRHAQKSFFKLRKSGTQREIYEWLAQSKQLEKSVDEYLIKFKERNSPQQKLF